jgi:S-DNA-T family DNA segregation ATPase FtsK/SpoIIIE
LRFSLKLFAAKGDEGDLSSRWERMSREIKGSIFSLLTLFVLVALTSYIATDSFSIFQGRFDHINNLGGIVGALAGEWFLGTAGISGYSIIIVMAGLAFGAFCGTPVRNSTFKLLGALLATLLASIACQLIWGDRVPDASLLQGGWIGKHLGEGLRHYFNTTGALLIITFGFVVTFILTTGASISRAVSKLFETDQIEKSSGDTAENVSPKISLPAKIEIEKEIKKPKRRSPVKKKDAVADDNAEEETDHSLAALTEAGEDEEVDEPKAGKGKKVDGPKEFTFQEIIPFDGKYNEPSLRLLKNAPGGIKKLSSGEMKAISRKLVEHLLSFQITGEVVNVSQGPVLTTFEFKPSAGVKLSKIAGLQDDLGIVLGTRELRIMAPIPGKTVVGIEVPRPQIETIALKDLLSQKEFQDKKLKIPFAIGKTTEGKPAFADMTAMPHLLVAGGTGSGKSVFINALIMSFLFRMSPQELRLILVDPKMLELNAFDGLPHLLTNVITSNEVAFNALSWAVLEMDRRYKLMADTASKNIESYNSKVRGTKKIPYIVIVVDELADLMLSGGEEVEIAITRLAQKARASGIHLVLATQRPSTDVVTGLIKANMPSRLSFKVPSAIDSRTVLDSSGAEELIGRGDSLMIQPGIPLRRLHGCFMTEEELARTVNFIKGGKDYSKYYIDFGGAKK